MTKTGRTRVRVVLSVACLAIIGVHAAPVDAQRTSTTPASQADASVVAAPCINPAAFEIERGRVTSAELVPEGPFSGGRGFGGRGQAPEPIPEHCRARMVLTQSSDSNINVELWLPTHNWNGKSLAVGIYTDALASPKGAVASCTGAMRNCGTIRQILRPFMEGMPMSRPEG